MRDIAIDMTGFRSGRLVVLARAPINKTKRAFWLCQCDCGAKCVVMGKYLRKLEVKSCGCLNRSPLDPEAKLKHGHSKRKRLTGTYQSWAGMLSRCRNTKNPKYPDYGGRGISVCSRWIEFKNFLADMGEKTVGSSIDRIKNDGDYEPGNCQWATAFQQANNSRRNRFIEFNGQTRTLTNWARSLGIAPSTLHARLRKGWSLEKALTLRSTRIPTIGANFE